MLVRRFRQARNGDVTVSDRFDFEHLREMVQSASDQLVSKYISLRWTYLHGPRFGIKFTEQALKQRKHLRGFSLRAPGGEAINVFGERDRQ